MRTSMKITHKDGIDRMPPINFSCTGGCVHVLPISGFSPWRVMLPHASGHVKEGIIKHLKFFHARDTLFKVKTAVLITVSAQVP
jgi:hypothetical protein